MNAARDIESVAANWVARREEPDWSAADEVQLQTWLEESHLHKATFWRLECGWRAADRIGALGPAAGVTADRRRTSFPGWRWFAIAASLAAVLVASPAILRLERSGPQPARVSHFQTAIGGHEQLALADGSTVELNTATTIRASMSRKQREIWLDKGEAFFSVAHSGVPFLVHAGPRLVTVVGTKFSVSRSGDKVRVAVMEGIVRVSDADKADPTPVATITRGDLLDAEGGSTLVLHKASAKVERSLAWRDGMLQFDQTPLMQAAQEFNRYNQRKLVIRGRAAMIPIGGSFQVSNVDAFVRLLHDAYGLRVEYTSTEMRVSG